MKFNKRDLQNLINDESDVLELVENKLVDRSRWTVQYRAIFVYHPNGKLYETFYRYDATEQQNEVPYEFEPNEIECHEVEEKPITSVAYVRVKE